MQNALEGLKEAHNRVTAWRDNAELWARRLPDLEAEPYRNQQANYEYLRLRIDAAITELTEFRQRFLREIAG